MRKWSRSSTGSEEDGADGMTLKKMKRAERVNSGGVAKQASEEAVMRKEMVGASEVIDRLREATKTPAGAESGRLGSGGTRTGNRNRFFGRSRIV